MSIMQCNALDWIGKQFLFELRQFVSLLSFHQVNQRNGFGRIKQREQETTFVHNRRLIIGFESTTTGMVSEIDYMGENGLTTKFFVPWTFLVKSFGIISVVSQARLISQARLRKALTFFSIQRINFSKRNNQSSNFHIIVERSFVSGIERHTNQRIRKREPIRMTNPDDKQLIKVVVPPKLGPGSRLIVRTPDGRSITAVVPKGCEEGSAFLVRVPPSQNPQTVIQKIKVPLGKKKGDKFKVKLPDGRNILATVPSDNCREFYLNTSTQSQQERQQNWHDNPLAVAPMFLGPML